jgi:hypothetical protein
MGKHAMVYESRGKRRKGKVVSGKKQPRLKRNVQAAWKGFVRQAKSVLAGAGLISVIVLIARALGGG